MNYEQNSENGRGLPPKKSLGQHFLTSEGALDRMVAAGGVAPGDAVLEIGPGKGALTARLLTAGATVVAIEKDDRLGGLLDEKFADFAKKGRFVLVRGDALEFDPASAPELSNGYKLVANIPYNITGELFRKYLSGRFQPSRMAVLVQREVAERVAADDGKESVLSMSVKCYGKPRFAGVVKAGSFFPKPNVDSAILEITHISRDFFANVSEEAYFKAIKAGFAQKRKLLKGNLKEFGDKEAVAAAFAGCGVAENARAEDVGPETFACLARALA